MRSGWLRPMLALASYGRPRVEKLKRPCGGSADMNSVPRFPDFFRPAAVCLRASPRHHLVPRRPGRLPHPGSQRGKSVLKCLACDYATSVTTHMERHQRTHTGERPYKCDHCDKTFSQKENLLQHVHIHTGERPFQCHLCPMDFTQQSGLTHHLRGHRRRTAFADDFTT